MSKTKTMYEEVLESIKKNASEKKSSRFSKNDYVNATTALLNSDDFEETIYVKQGDDATEVTSKPTYKFREALKPFVKQFGVDSAELDKVHDIPFSKSMGEAMYDVATSSIRNYMDTGRGFAFPMMSKDEASTTISVVMVNEKTVPTRKIEKLEDGSFASVPTGNFSTTKSHKIVKATNKVPVYLKK